MRESIPIDLLVALPDLGACRLYLNNAPRRQKSRRFEHHSVFEPSDLRNRVRGNSVNTEELVRCTDDPSSS